MNPHFRDIVNVDPQLLPEGLLEIYKKQLDIPGFKEDFDEEVKKVWADLTSDINTIQETGDTFDLEAWVSLYNNEAIQTLEENATDSLVNVSLKMLALYYVIRNLRGDIKGGIRDSAEPGFLLISESDSKIDENLTTIEGLIHQLNDHFNDKTGGL